VEGVRPTGMAHWRAVRAENSAPSREGFHVCHPIFDRGLKVVCEQNSPGLPTASEELESIGETCGLL